MKKGKLIIISGPSGVGKKTILEKIYNDKTLKIVPSISMTTRKPRFNEIEGKDYFFISKDQFLDSIKKNKFLEYAEYSDNFYGTPKEFIEKQEFEGNNILLEIETFGVKKIIEQDIEAIKIFVLPPSIDELKNRLLNRKTEDKDTINKRIEKAKEELKLIDLYDYSIINDNLDKAISDIKNILRKELNK